MSAYPRWLLLELAADADLPPPSPDVRTNSPQHQPEEHEPMPRMTDRECSREGCSNKLGSANKTGVCTPCQQGRKAHLPGSGSSPSASRRPARASKRRDADDAVLERVGLMAEAPPTSEASAAPASPPKPKSWFDRFCELHAALGLDAHQAIEDHCQAWVELTTSRALGEHVVSAPVPAKPKRARKPRANGAAPAESTSSTAEAPAHE